MHPRFTEEIALQATAERQRGAEQYWGQRQALEVVRRAEHGVTQSAGWAVGLVVAGALAGFLMPGAVRVLAPLLGIGAVIATALVLAQRERRRLALNRLVELEPLAPPPASIADAVAARRAHLVAVRHRCQLADAVRAALSGGAAQRMAASPGARALRREPDLADRVASRLEHDAQGYLLAIAVERLLATGGDGAPALDRVRRLVA